MSEHSARSGASDRATTSFDPRRAASIGAVLSAMALVVIDAGGLNLSLPSIASSLSTDPSTAILIVTSYQLAVVIALLPSAALGERYGLRRVFAAGVITFTAAAVMAAASASLPWLLLARFTQGLGASAILALGVALLRATVKDRLLGEAIGWNAMTVAMAAAAGPALAALVLSNFSWNWLFAFELPLGLVVLIATRALPRVAPNSQNVDYVSIALNVAAFGVLILGINIAAHRPLAAAGMIVASGFVFAALIAREARRARPLLPLDLLRSASFRNSILASVLCFIGQTSGLIALPFYLQESLNLSPLVAGFYMTVWPLSVAGTALFAGRFSRWASTSALCALGGGLLALGMFGVAYWPSSSPGLLVPFTMTSGIGFGLFQIANNRNRFLAAPLARSGAAGGLQGTARLLGQAGAAALVAQLFVFVPMEAAPNLAIGVAAVFALSASVVSVFRPNTR
jgi:DHA2 family multidrug resistance protein-like MFS transporter